MWLTYLEASRRYKSGELSSDEYIDHLLSRAAGGGHIDDEKEGGFLELGQEDPFAYSVWLWTGNYLLKDASPLKAVFVAYRGASLGELKEKIAALREDYGQDMMKSLALLALQDRRADVLKLCLAHSACYQTYAFEYEANRVDEDKDPGTFEVLKSSKFRQLYPRRAAREVDNDGEDDEDDEDEEDPAAAFDVGGRHPVDW